MPYTPPTHGSNGAVITIHFTQIQYTQNVFLNFNGLQRPNVSVATLVPPTVQKIPASAWT